MRIVECVEDSRMCRGLYFVERMVERANGMGTVENCGGLQNA